MVDITRIQIESLRRQLELLGLFLRHNETWAMDNSRPEISRQAHQETIDLQEIIDLLEQTRQEYCAILDLYGNDNQEI